MFRTVHKFGNVRFVVNTNESNSKSPMETRTKGRVYVTLNKRTLKPQYVTYYDREGKRNKTLDLQGGSARYFSNELKIRCKIRFSSVKISNLACPSREYPTAYKR